MAGEHTREDLNSRYAALQNDPIYLRLMEAYRQAQAAQKQYVDSGAAARFSQTGRYEDRFQGPSNAAGAGEAVRNYVMNHPSSAGAGLNFGPNAGEGSHRYSFDPNSGFTDDYDPWYANPGFWGPIAVGAGTLGLGALGGAFGGGGGAAGGAAPVSVGAGSAGIPGATLGVPAALPGAVSSIPAIGGTAASVAPVVGEGVRQGLLGPSAETATDVYEANGGNGSGLPSGTAGKVMKAIAALGGAVGGRALSNQAGSANVPPELQQMLALALSRAKSQQPLFDASNRGMYEMLPNFARTPTSQFPGGG